jgi:hypothetical protein
MKEKRDRKRSRQKKKGQQNGEGRMKAGSKKMKK